MQLTAICYEPKAMLVFSAGDVEVLKTCSRLHYDGVCKAASQQGGLIYGIANRVELSTGESLLRWRDIDLLCKVIEFPPEPLRKKALQLFTSLRGALVEMEKAKIDPIEYKEGV